jgi:hypothetical protein
MHRLENTGILSIDDDASWHSAESLLEAAHPAHFELSRGEPAGFAGRAPSREGLGTL